MRDFFTIISTTTLLVGVTFALVFGFVLETETPKFERLIDINGEIDSASVVNQALTFKVNRPVDLATVSRVEVTPRADFSITEFENELTITFNEPLESNTEYSVLFPTNVFDIYGDSFEEYSFEFTTQTMSIAFLSEDFTKLYQSDLLFQAQELLFESNNEITDFVIDNVGFVVVTESQENSIIHIRAENEHDISLNSKIVNDITTSDNLEQVFFVAGDVTNFEGNVIPTGGNNLYQLDVSSGDFEQVILNTDRFPDIIEVDVVPDGSAVLLKGIESTFFLVSTNDFSQFIELGKFLAVTDFNRFQNLYLTVEAPFGANVADFPFLTTVNPNSEKTAITDGTIYVLDPQFLDANTIVYANRIETNNQTRGFFNLSTLDLDTVTSVELVAIPERTVELPLVSPDGRYVVAEVYTQEELLTFEDLRSIGFQAKPGTAELIVYDLVSGELVRNNVRGVEAQWVF